MIIIGIDPGTLHTGFGVINHQRNRLTMITVGIIDNASSVSMPIRLRQIYKGLSEVIDRYHPDEFAIETAFYHKNAQSALKIGQARGVAILSGVNREIPVSEYSPREIKKAVTGKGSASKEQVHYMMKSLLGVKNIPEHFDASDALAVAVCHAFKISAPRSAYKDWKTYVEAHPHKIISSQ